MIASNRLFSALLAAALTASTTQADSISYAISDLGTLPGTSMSAATGINNQGQVVGVSYNSADGAFVQNLSGTATPPRFQQTGNGAQSFLYSGGQMSQIYPVGGLATSVNDSGQTVGGQFTSINASGQYVGSLAAGVLTDTYTSNPWSQIVSGGTVTNLPVIFDPYSINNAGQVVGRLVVNASGEAFHPAVFQGGQVTDLFNQTVGGNGYTNGRPIGDARAIAINQNGDTLINFVGAGNKTYSLLYSTATGAVIANLASLPGGSGMIGAALNTKDQVVGNGFLYSSGTFQTLASLIPASSGWSNLNATGINESGQIVGQGLIDGQEHAFLMTPQSVPEPSTLALFGLGFALLGVAAHKRGRVRPA